jgi:hypothetical protein
MPKGFLSTLVHFLNNISADVMKHSPLGDEENKLECFSISGMFFKD